MSTFPEGNFTIVNNETGRCVRVRLGRTKDVGYHKEGTKYLQYVTAKPKLELAAPDDSPATAWWFSTIEDGSERRPFNQIVSHAVEEYQNIGRYCVWLDTDPLTEHDDRDRSRAAFETKLNAMPDDLRNRLAELIPEEWKTLKAEARRAAFEHWKENAYEPRRRVRIEVNLQALAQDEDPPTAEKLAQFKAVMERQLANSLARQQDNNAEPVAMSEADRALWAELEAQPRWARVFYRAEDLFPAAFEQWKKSADSEWQRKAPVEDTESWHRLCSRFQFVSEDIRLTSPHYTTDQDKRVAVEVRAYLEAAAKEGVLPSLIASGAGMRMYGCGSSRYKGSTYRWEYDGTYIYGADDRTVPSERTYWTDEDGSLVGKSKGGPGQTWTIAPWKMPVRKNEQMDPLTAILTTGLYGPIAVFRDIFKI